MKEHLARHRLADLFLDTFNFNAHTTASEALWAGLPVVTKMGKGFASRVAASLLNALDCPELITETKEDYEALIMELATDPKKLLRIREKVTSNRLSKPLFNTELYIKNLENSFKQVHENYIHENNIRF
jgi:predicted O-linked N-acetylglucosamine transferase (SPINDLY family)